MELYQALTHIKSLDGEMTSKILSNSGVSLYDFAEYVNQYLGELRITLNDVDIISLAYAFIAECGHVPILKEYIYSNYLDTRFDISPEKATKILVKTPKSKRNEAWKWLKNETR
jgi:hypothetical protein